MRQQPELDPARISRSYVNEVREELRSIGKPITVVGLIASNDAPSQAYAQATQAKFAEVGINYDLQTTPRLALESTILALNEDPGVHGVFIYFPVFHNQQDSYLRNLVDYRKDIEAGSAYWTRKLYANDRYVDNDPHKKALLPCTPLAIVKILTSIGTYDTEQTKPLEARIVTVFNRSEVIGRPLAVMLSNDGALVYSFDEFGPLQFRSAVASEIEISRSEALTRSDIVITGVPGESFPRVGASEVKPDAVCLNFSSTPNFADDINARPGIYIPRIGPMTVAMCMRNTLRLFKNFHDTAG